MAAWASSRRPAPRSTMRDARIAPIYEGTNGIQAIDLVARKLPLSGGETVRRADRGDARHRRSGSSRRRRRPSARPAPRLRDAVESLDRATSFMLKAALRQRARGGARRRDAVSAPVRAGAGRRGARRGGARRERRRRRPATPIRRTRPASRSAASSPRTSRRAARGLEETVIFGAAFVEDAPLALAS